MKPGRTIFSAHGRKWRDFQYVYPVISRRARGLSIGINLNPGAECNYGCVYCQVDRRAARPVKRVDPAVLARELGAVVQNYRSLFDEPEFRDTPPEYRRLNDIAFSGDGEPTGSPLFAKAARLAIDVRREAGVSQARIVVITNACFLARPKVAETLALLDQHNGEIWAKLDAGSEEYHQRVNRPSHSLQHVLDNILFAARLRPLAIQSLFPRLHGKPPERNEIDAYVERLRWLLENGGQILLVQIYTVARAPTEPYVAALTAGELQRIAERVRRLGLRAECYP